MTIARVAGPGQHSPTLGYNPLLPVRSALGLWNEGMNGQAVRYIGAGIAGLAGLALVIAAVMLLTRSDDAAPVRIAAPEDTVSEMSADIKAQVSGEVMFPGVYALNPGDRVIDAIAAAGGIGPNADLSGINLSKRVQDEGRYHVPAFGESTPALSVAVASSESESGGLIDLNTAPARELETLPGIGPVMAGRIIAHRDANGPFANIDDVMNVSGIGPKTLDAIRQMVTVSGGP